jgi:hypothetical protein
MAGLPSLQWFGTLPFALVSFHRFHVVDYHLSSSSICVPTGSLRHPLGIFGTFPRVGRRATQGSPGAAKAVWLFTVIVVSI